MTFDVEAIRDALPTRQLEHHLLAVTVEAAALEWARRRDAPIGSIVLADSEVSPRRMRGVPVFDRGPALAFVVAAGDTESLLTLRAVVALVEALGADYTCGWPNTVLRGSEVVGVIAVELLAPRFERHVAALRWRDVAVDESTIAIEVARRFELADVVSRFTALCPWIDREVRVDLTPRGTVDGVVRGIASSGSLQLEMGSGRVGDLPAEQVLAVRLVGN